MELCTLQYFFPLILCTQMEQCVNHFPIIRIKRLLLDQKL